MAGAAGKNAILQYNYFAMSRCQRVSYVRDRLDIVPGTT